MISSKLIEYYPSTKLIEGIGFKSIAAEKGKEIEVLIEDITEEYEDNLSETSKDFDKEEELKRKRMAHRNIPPPKNYDQQRRGNTVQSSQQRLNHHQSRNAE